jgi:hypothetical protein
MQLPVKLGLSDHQLHLVWSALEQLPTERARSEFLQLLDTQLRTRTLDLEDAIDRGRRAVTQHVSS